MSYRSGEFSQHLPSPLQFLGPLRRQEGDGPLESFTFNGNIAALF